MNEQEQQEPPKPGVKTTEFWLALAVVVIGAVVAAYPQSPLAQVFGVVASALTAAGYGFARAQVKRAPQIGSVVNMVGGSLKMDGTDPPTPTPEKTE